MEYLTPEILLLGILCLLGFALLVGLFVSIKSVPQHKVWVVERLGKYRATLQTGIHVLIPFLDEVVAKLPLGQLRISFPDQIFRSQDRQMIQISGSLSISLQNPVKTAYAVQDYISSSLALVNHALSNYVQKRDLDLLMDSKSSIETSVTKELERPLNEWGIQIHRFETLNISKKD